MLPVPAHSATYYLDAAVVGETGDGSLENPWKTLAQAQAVVVSGDVVNILSGDYGRYSENNVIRTDYVIYQAVDGQVVNLDGVSVNNSTLTNTYLKFMGINFKPAWVDPCSTSQVGCDDPQYAESTTTTYSKTADVVNLNNAKYVQIHDSVLEGQNRYLTSTGVYALNSSYITIADCTIKNIIHGIRFVGDSTNNAAIGNHIHGLAGTGLSSHGYQTVSNILFERNHIHDGLVTNLPDYAPKKEPLSTYGYHGSGISIRNGDVTVRGNIIRNTGSSAGIKLYEDESDYINDNVLIENNLVYDVGSLYAISVAEAGPNVVIRNNTVIARNRFYANGGNAQFRTAFLPYSVDLQNGTPDIQIHNNIFIGIAKLDSPYITESNNVVWTTSTSTITPVVHETTYVMTSSYSYYPWAELGAMFKDPTMTFANDHGRILDFTLKDGSLGINRGNPTLQPAKSMGALDADNAFIIDSNPLRAGGNTMVGAYGFGAIHSLAIAQRRLFRNVRVGEVEP